MRIPLVTLGNFGRIAAGAALAQALATGLAPHALAEGGPSLSIVAPGDGAVVTSTDIPVRVSAQNFTVACDEAGLPERDGAGHFHVMLDGMTMAQLTNFYCTHNFCISGLGVLAGQHTLTIDLATSDHADMEETAQSVTFLYQPATPPAALPAPGSFLGARVAITAPADGATVDPQFRLEVQATNFTASCDLEGKRNVAGHGHYHLFVDEDLAMPMDMSMAMMNMPGMVSMPCTNTIPVDLSAWPSGEHTIAIELEQNDHTPVMEPGQGAKFATITVKLQNPFMP